MSGDVSVSPSRLTFTTSDWDEWKIVEVNGGSGRRRGFRTRCRDAEAYGQWRRIFHDRG